MVRTLGIRLEKEGMGLQLTLFQQQTISRLVLSAKVGGQFWVTALDEAGQPRELATVEGIDGQWILKSNRRVELRDGQNQGVKALVVTPMNFYHLFDRQSGEHYLLYAEPVTDDRKKFRKLLFAPDAVITIGRNEDNALSYPSRFVSAHHAEIVAVNQKLLLTDLNSSNGTFVNGRRAQTQELRPGDSIYIVGLKLIVGNGFLAVNNPDQQVYADPAVLTPLKPLPVLPQEEEEEETELPAEDGVFYRSPRFKREVETAVIKLDPPPPLGTQESTPLMLTLGPSMTMGMASLFTGLFSYYNVVSSGGDVKQALPSLVMAGSMLCGTVLWPIFTKLFEKRHRRAHERERQKKYSAYLEEKRQEIAEESYLQKEIIKENFTSLEECGERILEQKRNLWERMDTHNDFLQLRLGIGDLPMDLDLKFPEKRFTMEDDTLQKSLYRLAEQPQVLSRVPVTVSLREKRILGIVGERPRVLGLARGMILQLVSLHSYDDVKLVFFYNPAEREQLAFLKWAPHVWDNDRKIRFLASEPGELKEVSAYLNRLLAAREGEDEPEKLMPHYVVFAMDRELSNKSELVTGLLAAKEPRGFSLVALYDTINNLPKECNTVIDLGEKEGRFYNKEDISGQHQVFQSDFQPLEACGPLGVALGNIRLNTMAGAYVLPKMITFLEMFGVGKIEHLNALTRWRENDPTKTLETAVGVDRQGDLFKLDLHEKFHGPHGLVAGMTGSGKSEFIMTYILSMAVNYHPYEVAFILIDYKGGGMAKAFENLPHTAGIITNLDGAAVNRSLISIQSELKRRQAIFSATSKAIGVSNIDIYKYQRLYREGTVKEPLQHLFIISDEFAELKTQQPEFMQQLISAARIGRSLGVHLILATQKPAGVVDDQIWSNSRFRVCLKVQEKADSMDMLKRPDAAELTDTGRFYLQVGYNEIFELGQSAWSGAAYVPADRVERKKDLSIAVLDPIGRVLRQMELEQRKAAAVKKAKQLDSITEYLASLAREEQIQVKPLWLPPMPPRPLLAELEARYPAGEPVPGVLNPLIGMLDDPVNQRQAELRLPLTAEGNVIVYGAAGSGKTTFLIAMCCSLLRRHTAEEVNLYLLDFGSEVLKCFSAAPQVGDVLLSYEREKMGNLFKMLSSELERRKRACAEYGGDFLSMLRRGEKMPSIVVAIQNYSGFSENYDNLEDQLAYLTREGTKYGIYFVLTALTTNAVRYRMMQNFRQLFVLQLNDPSEYSGVLGSVGGTYPAKMKGRGIFKQDQVYEFQLAFASAEEPVTEAVRVLAGKLKAGWNGPSAPRVPILPERVDEEFVREALPQEVVAEYPVGVDKETLQIARYPFEKRMITLLFSRSGAPGFVSALCRVIAMDGRIPLTVLDPKRELEELPDAVRTLHDGFDGEIGAWFEELVYRHNHSKEVREQGGPAPVFEKRILLIHGLAALREALSADALDKFKLLLEKCQPSFGVTFLFTVQAEQVASFSFEPWFRTMGTLNHGIWIGSGIADQYQLKIAKITNQLYEELEDDFGYLVQNGKPRLVKLLTSRKEGEEDG